MIVEAIGRVVDGSSLSAVESQQVMDEIMGGEATDAQIAALITGLRVKGETVEEITGCARAMRQRSARVQARVDGLIDTCGTGGDGSHTFNISTLAAFVAAGAGAKVAKHGNRSVSSLCGSADVLEALGVNLALSPEAIARCIDEVGMGFLFAPSLHPAMKYAIGPRREIAIRTIFNILGPLTNPAGATAQLVGVYRPELTHILAMVLGELGAERALVVHGSGLDELTLAGESVVSQFSEGKVVDYRVLPEDVGLGRASLEALRGGDAAENARIARAVLDGETGPRRDVVALNAGAALVAGGLAGELKEGLSMAFRSIDDGAALSKLHALAAYTQREAQD